jgi:PAS domain S-box-containing protein
MSGQLLQEVMRLQHPHGLLVYEWLREQEGALLLLEHPVRQCVLRGQCMVLEESSLVVLLLNPWLQSMDEVSKLGLKINDFGAHDQTLDLLHLVHAQRQANRDLESLATKLRYQREQMQVKEAEARRLAMVVAKTGDAVVITNREGSIEWVNDAFTKLTEWTLAEVKGRRPGSFLQGPLTDRGIAADMKAKVARGEGFHAEIVNYKKSGATYWVAIETQPVLDAKGVLCNFTAVERDITSRKREELLNELELAAGRVQSQVTTQSDAIEALLEEISKRLGWSKGGYWVLDDERSALIMRSAWCSQHANLERFVQRGHELAFKLGDSLPGLVWKQMSALSINDMQASDVDCRHDEAKTSGLRAGLAFPITCDGEFLGVMEFFSSKLEPLAQGLVEHLDSFGAQIGQMLRRLEAQERILETEQALKEAQQLSHLGSWSYDIASGKVFWSDEKYRIYGLEPQSLEITLDYCFQVIHEEDRAAVRETFQKCIETGAELTVAYRAVRPDGTLRHVRVSSNLNRNREGVPTRLVGTVLDITEIIEIQSQLYQTEQRWHHALENNGLGVWDWNIVSGYVLYTNRLQQMLGYEPGEWPAHVDSWASRVHPDDNAGVMAAMTACLAGETPDYICEHRLRCKDGGWKWVQDVGRIVSFTPEGAPLRMIGTQMDIDSRKTAERASERRELLMNQIRSAQAAFIGANQFDEAFEEILQILISYSCSQMGVIGEVQREGEIGLRVESYVVKGFPSPAEASLPAGLRQSLEKALQVGEPVIDNHVDRSLVAGCTWDNSLTLPITSGLDLLGVIWVSNREGGYVRQMINELDPLLAAAGGMIVARREAEKRARIEEALREAKERAEAGSRAKSDFLATMSHEIRTPMNGVIGMARVLHEAKLDARQREMVSAIVQSGSALMTLIDDILDFAKIEANQVQLRDQEVGIDELVNGVIELIALEAQSKHLDFNALIDPTLPDFMLADAGRLRQVLLNLVGNAVKFTDQGNVTLSLKRMADSLEVRVKDSGIGISSEDQRQLFKPFSQVDMSAIRRHGGTGLGLAICKDLVEMMHGQIGVESEVGIGSEFWFRIPLRPTATRRALRPSAAREQRVLVGEPSLITTTVFNSILAGLDVAPVFARSASEVIEMLADGHVFEWVFVDDTFVQGELQQVLTRLARTSSDHQTKIVILGSSDRRSKIPSSMMFLAKPLRRNLVRDLILSSEIERDEPVVLAPESGKRRGRVLVVEDNAVNAQLATLLLNKLGFDVDWSENGALALQQFLRKKYVAVLMDCRMPVMDGYEATSQIRKIEAEKGRANNPVLIVATTANAFPQDRQRCLDAGMNDYLAKPYDAKDLRRVLGELCTKSKSAGDRVRKEIKRHLSKLSDDVGDESILRLLELWRAELPDRLNVLSDMVAKDDFAGIASGAHKIKGSVSVFGLDRIAMQCQALEESAKLRSKECHAIHDRLQKEFSAAHRILMSEWTKLKRRVAL